jgi:predicted metal-dependent hydrolase
MEYTISYKKIRHGYARLSTDGKLNLTIPTFLKNDENFKKSLISKWSKLLSRYRKRTHIQAHTLDSVLLFWELISFQNLSSFYKGGGWKPEDLNKKQLDTYLKETLYEYIKPIVDKYSELIWNNYEQIKIRKLKSKRWSCAHDNTLLFNLDLVHLSTKYIRYVVIHEVCHIKHKNHSSRFRDLVAQYCPDYKLLRKELKNFIIK